MTDNDNESQCPSFETYKYKIPTSETFTGSSVNLITQLRRTHCVVLWALDQHSFVLNYHDLVQNLVKSPKEQPIRWSPNLQINSVHNIMADNEMSCIPQRRNSQQVRLTARQQGYCWRAAVSVLSGVVRPWLTTSAVNFLHPTSVNLRDEVPVNNICCE